VEKCLKALFLALFGMNRQISGHTNVKDLCEELQRNAHWPSDPPVNLMPQVIEVSSHYLRCRYPDYNSPMMEPARVYAERFQEAEDAVTAVRRILETIEQIASIADLMRQVQYNVPVQAVAPFDPNAHPQEWAPHEEGVKLKEIPLREGSQEYNVVADLFHSSMGTHVRIYQIVRIQNVDLWRDFSHRRQMFAEQQKPSHDRLTFHGTGVNKPREIYASQRGLDIVRSDKGAYGRGIYLAKDASVSHGYRHTDRGFNQLLVIRTLLGQVNINVRDGPAPTRQVQGGVVQAYDSIQGTLGGRDIYIVHRNDQTYPAYLITYQ
jgi:HEPN domain-containing protein